jgi:hypothetical protein
MLYWQCDCGQHNTDNRTDCGACRLPRPIQLERPPGRYCAACGRSFTGQGEGSVEVQIPAGLAHPPCARRLGLQPFEVLQSLEPIGAGPLAWSDKFSMWAAGPRDAVEAVIAFGGDHPEPGQVLYFRIMNESGFAVRAQARLAVDLVPEV